MLNFSLSDRANSNSQLTLIDRLVLRADLTADLTVHCKEKWNQSMARINKAKQIHRHEIARANKRSFTQTHWSVSTHLNRNAICSPNLFLTTITGAPLQGIKRPSILNQSNERAGHSNSNQFREIIPLLNLYSVSQRFLLLLGSRLLVALASEVILELQNHSFYRAPLHSMPLIWYRLLMPLSKDGFFPHVLLTCKATNVPPLTCKAESAPKRHVHCPATFFPPPNLLAPK